MELILQMPFMATSVGFLLLTVFFCMQPEESTEDIPTISNFNLQFTMNYWLTKKVPVLAASVGIVFISVLSCNKQEETSITDGLKFTASNDLYYNPLNIQVIDAGNESSYPETATVTIGGKDKAKILSAVGGRVITLKGGFIELGVTKGNKPSASNPLEFNVLIQATGYLSALKCFKIVSSTEPAQEVIKMVKTTALPEGVSFTSRQAGLDASSRVTSDVSSTVSGLSLTLKQGTKLFDSKGKLLAGRVAKISLWRFDATKETSVDAMPGGLLFCNATDDRNNNLGNGVFTPFGYFNATVTVNGVEAKTFSIPLVASMTIPGNIKRTVNSANESANSVRAGDLLAVWSLNAAGQWAFERIASPAVALRTGFNVQFPVSHLSFWAVADPSSPALFNWLRDGRVGAVPSAAAPCPNAGAQIQSNLSASASTRYFTKVRNAHNPWMTIGNFSSDFANNSSINLSNLLGGSNQAVRFDIFQSEGGQNLTRTNAFSPCNRPSLNLVNRIVRPANSFNFNISMNALCRNGGTTTNVLPTAHIFFAEVGPTGALRWKYLTQLVNGQATTNKLIKGVDYQFLVMRGQLRATTAQLGFPRLNFPRNNAPCTVNFRNADWGLNQDVTALATDPNTYTLNLTDFIAPAILCEKFAPFF
jgi:hypothetical protein